MKGKYLLPSHEVEKGKNIYAPRSALVLDWLLRIGIDKREFSVREISREIGVSVGLVQGV